MGNETEALIVELIDEDGVAVEFEHLHTIAHEGQRFIVLLPLSKVEGVEDDEVMIMRVETHGDEDVYLPIENDVLLEEVFSMFLEAIEDEEEDMDENELPPIMD